MKRILSLVLVILMVVLPCAFAEEKPTIGIVIQKENGAFLDMKQGILNKLAENGYTEETAEIVYQCAQGDATTLATICSSMDGYDLVFCIATPATQQFVNLESETPCFFCAVSAPVAAGVITEMETPDKNATGTSNAIPVGDIFALADVLTPGLQKYGLIYSTSETNAVTTVEACEAYLDSVGVEYVAKTINSSADVATVTEALIADGVDAIFVPNDSNVQAGVTALAELCAEYSIPTYCSSATTVASGCFATIAIDDTGIGEKTAELALEYLNGTAIGEIPAIVVAADYVSVNTNARDALGLTLEDDTLQVGDATYAVNYLAD
ncbi:MAG: ABC transporter substrate-binding protein [Candidatus Faecivicinus sp.]